MHLIGVHKVMIGAAIGASLLFAGWAGWMFARGGPAFQLALSGVAVAVAVALVVYLRGLGRRLGGKR